MAKKIPLRLYAPLGSRDSAVAKDARLVNGFVEKDTDDQQDDGAWVYKRPGLLLYSAVASASTARGVFNWKGNIYSIFGSTLYKDGVSKGTVDTTSSYTFAPCLGATPKLFLKNTAKAYTYDDTNGLVLVNDANYPATTVPGCAYLDGTTYVFDTSAQVLGSTGAANDPRTWDPLNKLVAQIEPDASVALAKQLVYLVALKGTSTEVFYDAGNASGSPLAPVLGSKLGVGCQAAASLVRAGDDLLWIGTTNEGDVQVTKMSKVHGETVSTPVIDKILTAWSYSNILAWSAKEVGHRFYGITSVTNNLTLVYDLSVGEWYIWTDTAGNYFPIAFSTYDSGGNSILQHTSNGKLYILNANTYQDDGVNIPVTIYGDSFDGGLRTEKTVSTFEVVGDRIPTNVSVSWSDDDYQAFSTPQTIALDQDAPLGQDGSSFRRRSYLLTHTDNQPLRLKRLDLMVTGGTL